MSSPLGELRSLIKSFTDRFVEPTFYPHLPSFNLFYTNDPRLTPLDSTIQPHNAMLGLVPSNATYPSPSYPLVFSHSSPTSGPKPTKASSFERPPPNWEKLDHDVLNTLAQRHNELVRVELETYMKELGFVLDDLFYLFSR